MDIGIAELVKSVTKLVERAEHGEDITITRHGKPVAMLTRPPQVRRKPKLGTGTGLIELLPGWDKPLPTELWDAYK